MQQLADRRIRLLTAAITLAVLVSGLSGIPLHMAHGMVPGHRTNAPAHSLDASGSEAGGGVYADTTWTKQGSPYVLTDKVVVFPSVTLRIDPGVEVRSRGWGIEVRGKLLAIGNSTQHITFTAESERLGRGGWGGVRIVTLDGGSGDFQFTDFSYAYKALSIEAGSSVQQGQNAPPTFVRDSTFRHNEVGIMGDSLAPTTIERSVFQFNEKGAWADGRRVFCKSRCLDTLRS